MFILKKNRILIYQYLFQEGVVVAKKDFFAPTHPDIAEVTNLEVLCMMRSLTSRGYTRETFNWQYFYYYLTSEGIEYLRDYLHLPEETIPATLKKPVARPARSGPPPGDRPGGRFDQKKVGPVGDFNPQFQGEAKYPATGGYGRGGGAAI